MRVTAECLHHRGHLPFPLIFCLSLPRLSFSTICPSLWQGWRVFQLCGRAQGFWTQTNVKQKKSDVTRHYCECDTDADTIHFPDSVLQPSSFWSATACIVRSRLTSGFSTFCRRLLAGQRYSWQPSDWSGLNCNKALQPHPICVHPDPAMCHSAVPEASCLRLNSSVLLYSPLWLHLCLIIKAWC